MADTPPKTTLEQWHLLATVIESGGFAQAAKRLHRSQSAISYGVACLQTRLGVRLLETRGRRAVLSDAGKVLLDQARPLIADMFKLEAKAGFLEKGWESEIRLAVDGMFPRELLFKALKTFQNTCPQTRIVMNEVILSGADEALLSGEADLIIGSRIPTGYMGQPLYTVRLVPVAHPGHPLHQTGEPLRLRDLSGHIHIIIRDSGRNLPRSEGWQGARQRWSVSSLEASIAAVSHGMGFAWLPEHAVSRQIETGCLQILPLLPEQTRSAILYLIQADTETAGPGIRQLQAELHQVCTSGRTPAAAP